MAKASRKNDWGQWRRRQHQPCPGLVTRGPQNFRGGSTSSWGHVKTQAPSHGGRFSCSRGHPRLWTSMRDTCEISGKDHYASRGTPPLKSSRTTSWSVSRVNSPPRTCAKPYHPAECLKRWESQIALSPGPFGGLFAPGTALANSGRGVGAHWQRSGPWHMLPNRTRTFWSARQQSWRQHSDCESVNPHRSEYKTWTQLQRRSRTSIKRHVGAGSPDQPVLMSSGSWVSRGQQPSGSGVSPFNHWSTGAQKCSKHRWSGYSGRASTTTCTGTVGGDLGQRYLSDMERPSKSCSRGGGGDPLSLPVVTWLPGKTALGPMSTCQTSAGGGKGRAVAVH